MTKYTLIFLCLFFCKTDLAMVDNSVVESVDINRYLGKWYEIARFDHRFERDMVGVCAEYTMRKDGKIKVLNSGYKHSFEGEYSQAIGKAKLPDTDEPGKLKVSFFLFFYGDYYILDLDEDYEWALIGSSTDKYLWILSRHPKMDANLLCKLLTKLNNRGYPTDKLIFVDQRGE